MKKTYFLPSALDINKVGPILEHIKLNVNANKNLKLLMCGGALQSCSVNPRKNMVLCFSCKKNMKNIFKSFDFLKNVELESLTNYSFETKAIDSSFDYNSLKEIQQLYWDNHQLDVGWSIVSTFVSKRRDISDKITSKERKILKQNYNDSVILYQSFLNYLGKNKIDEIIIFNGRMFDTRPVLRACLKNNISCRVLEIGGYKLKNWITFNNTLPHNITEYTKKIFEEWMSEKDEQKKKRIGEKFFKLRYSGMITNDRSYTSAQDKKMLPKYFNKDKINIVIFNSSEDEIFSIGPEWKKLFDSQFEGIKHICEMVKNDTHFQIYLRIHPNLSNIDAPFVQDLLILDSLYNNIKVIKPDSEISSYKLLLSCNKVITFGSTLGIEATYWNKPSLCLSSSLYMNIDGAYIVKSSNDPNLKKFIYEELEPKPKINAIKYGYYQMNAGKPFKYWKNDEFHNKRIPSPSIIEKLLYHLYEKIK